MTNPMPTADRGLRALGCALGISNAILWFAVVPIAHGWDRMVGRLDFPGGPHRIFGVQELLVYFDVWPALYVLPIAYTFGFAAIGILFRTPRQTSGRAFGSREAIGVGIVLLGCEAVWIGLIAMVVAFRGPDWNFCGPFESWEQAKIVPRNQTFLSALFWSPSFPDNELLLHAPGLALAAAYLMVGIVLALALWRGRGYLAVYLGLVAIGCVVLSRILPLEALAVFGTLLVVFGYLVHRWAPRSELPRVHLPFWRCLLIGILVAIVVAVPIKIVLYQMLNVREVARLGDFLRI
jgi:hypothetical protein